MLTTKQTESYFPLAPKVLSKEMENASLRSESSSPTSEVEEVGKRRVRHRGSREPHEISVETVKLPEDVTAKQAWKLKSSKESTPDSVLGSVAASSDFMPDRLGALSQIQFYSGNHFVEVTKGILHLFKENKATPLGEEAERSELVCLLSVPTSMTTHDLLQFTAPVSQDIENMRIIRDNKPNQYMVLIKFRNQRSADEFYNNFNGMAYNTIEPEVCHLVYVAKVETLRENDTRCGLPITGHTELPTCPVCLERMDESVEGILTILCNHSFHGNCLDKWGDSSCPVCRYCQTPEQATENSCFECGSQQDSLWICLVCGHIGCGRYVEGHAYKHYCDTQHTYAMQLGLNNNRVWDYAGDNYVHRLLQNKSDGKVVEVECNPSLHASEEKIDSVQLEYTYLLTTQLETQRHYFEEAINRIEKDAQNQIDEIRDKSKIVHEEREKLDAKLSVLTKEKQVQDKKISQVNAKMSKMVSELQEEREMNKCLRENQSLWQEKLAESEQRLTKLIEKKDQEIGELKDQVRDLMFFLEAQQKLQDVPEGDATREEIEGSSIVMSPSQASGSARPRSKGKKK